MWFIKHIGKCVLIGILIGAPIICWLVYIYFKLSGG